MNYRIEVVIAIGVLAAITVVPLAPWERWIAAMIVGILLAAELINTAIEHAVDTATTQWSPTARVAKDAAAGAVLTLVLLAAAYGSYLVWRVGALYSWW